MYDYYRKLITFRKKCFFLFSFKWDFVGNYELQNVFFCAPTQPASSLERVQMCCSVCAARGAAADLGCVTSSALRRCVRRPGVAGCDRQSAGGAAERRTCVDHCRPGYKSNTLHWRRGATHRLASMVHGQIAAYDAGSEKLEP